MHRRGRRPLRRIRLDEAVSREHPGVSKQVIRSWILQGKVLVDGQKALKAGHQVRVVDTGDADADAEARNKEEGGHERFKSKEEDEEMRSGQGWDSRRLGSRIEYLNIEMPRYVCRAGDKLAAALESLSIDVRGKVAMDSGISTGGFTDCLLQHGAARVYGVDVGYGQVADRIRRDPRVHVMERTNLRHLESLPEPVDLVTLDLSFISILKVMPAVARLAAQRCELITLIKPQFEAGREHVGGGGIVRDDAVRMRVLRSVSGAICDEYGWEMRGWIESPVHGAGGNREFLAHFVRTERPS